MQRSSQAHTIFGFVVYELSFPFLLINNGVAVETCTCKLEAEVEEICICKPEVVVVETCTYKLVVVVEGICICKRVVVVVETCKCMVSLEVVEVHQ